MIRNNQKQKASNYFINKLILDFSLAWNNNKDGPKIWDLNKKASINTRFF